MVESVIEGTFHVWLPNRGFIQDETRFLDRIQRLLCKYQEQKTSVIVVGHMII